MDARGWRQADLARRSGLHRSLISKLLKDNRDHLGQMPDDSTIDGIARGFGIPADAVRQAAARSLVGYVDTPEGHPLDSYSLEYLAGYVARKLAARTSDEPKPE
jgi:transcriptional regulator with XRE-family HTH domain